MTEQEYVTLKARYKAEADEADRLIKELEQGTAEKPGLHPGEPLPLCVPVFYGDRDADQGNGGGAGGTHLCGC